jgi:hypothetical protein
VFLGMVSPYAVKLKINNLNTSAQKCIYGCWYGL